MSGWARSPGRGPRWTRPRASPRAGRTLPGGLGFPQTGTSAAGHDLPPHRRRTGRPERRGRLALTRRQAASLTAIAYAEPSQAPCLRVMASLRATRQSRGWRRLAIIPAAGARAATTAFLTEVTGRELLGAGSIRPAANAALRRTALEQRLSCPSSARPPPAPSRRSRR